MTIYSPMRQIEESLQQVVRDNERRELRRAKRIARKPAKIEMAIKYLEKTHTYQLIVNGKTEGEPVEMLGSEAKEQNRIFKERFTSEINAAIDSGKPFGQTGAVLRHWKWVK